MSFYPIGVYFFPEAKISWDYTVFFSMMGLWIITPEATFHTKRTVDIKIGALLVLGKERGDWWGSLLPGKLTRSLKNGGWKMKFPSEMAPFRCHVTFRGNE